MCSLANTGYGIASKYIVRELVKQDKDIYLFPHGGIQYDSIEELNLYKKLIEKNKSLDWNSPCLNIWHQFDLAKRIGNGKYIAFPIFELDRFNDNEKNHLNGPNHIFVTSKWANDILESNKIKTKSSVVNLGVDTNIFHPKKTISDKTYRFINLGKFEKRKGHDVLIEAFCKAFEISDDVELVMLANNPFLDEQEMRYWYSLYKESKLGDKIIFIDTISNHSQVADLIRSCDCGVFPSRAEGWNLELLECMSCGLDCIATNYSSHTEYCNSNNCNLIEVNDLEDAYDGKWFFGNGQWAEVEVDNIVELMRICFKNRKINLNGVETSNKFNWSNTIGMINASIEI